MPVPPPQARSLVWLTHFKVRPCVVMGVAEGRVVIMPGTSKLREDVPHVRVSVNSADGCSWGLTATTYFYARRHVVALASLPSPVGFGTEELYLRLRALK